MITGLTVMPAKACIHDLLLWATKVVDTGFCRHDASARPT
jgi:hypothetical protein